MRRRRRIRYGDGDHHLSIHAPARGATPHAKAYRPSSPRTFNPRTRAGCDFRRQPHDFFLPVSFNPRTRAGCDGGRSTSRRRRSSFNPRTRAGCDSSRASERRSKATFNPRTRAGCDRSSRSCSRAQRRYFQSTHPRGVRPVGRLLCILNRLILSIHAPARGATRTPACRYSTGTALSIHAPARGATPFSAVWDPRAGRAFNPRTRAGCDSMILASMSRSA